MSELGGDNQARRNPELTARDSSGRDRSGGFTAIADWLIAIDHLICPSALSTDRFSLRRSHAGRELAPAFTELVNRLLWRHRARPSATLDKMRAELLLVQKYSLVPGPVNPRALGLPI
jgi:hypothetical protein